MMNRERCRKKIRAIKGRFNRKRVGGDQGIGQGKKRKMGWIKEELDIWNEVTRLV